MKIFLARILLIMFCLCNVLLQSLHAQTGTTTGDFKKAGGSGSQFLKIGIGTRATGMGGAFVGLANDLSTIYWNPAGLTTLQGINFSAQHTSWFADMSHDFVAVSFQLGDQYRFGVSATYFNAGSIEITTIELPEGTGASYTVGDISIGFTFAAILSDEFSFGVTGKYVENDIYDLSARGIAFDVGTLYKTDFNNLKIGMSISNFSGEFSFEGQSLIVSYQNSPYNRPLESQLMNQAYSLPLIFRGGIAVDVIENIDNNKVTVAGDFVSLSDNPEKLNVGAEYSWDGLVLIRSGYNFNTDEMGLNIGGGLHYKAETFDGIIDYAWSEMGRLGNIHRFGVSLKF